MVKSELLQKMRNLHPNILSRDMEKVFEIDLSDDERIAFEDSVAEVKDSIAKLDL